MAKKELSANIFWLYPIIHSLNPVSGKVEGFYAAKIDRLETDEKGIKISFLFDGSKYGVDLKKSGNNFQGRIIRDGEMVGKAYYVLYTNDKGFLLWGEWSEEEYNQSSIIEVLNMKFPGEV
ncbi:MAG: hypothetical protein POELPBGB_03031 [Bacteroidia bacterium]|nr:hypothetical protein [Bacteroidia bacterium]